MPRPPTPRDPEQSAGDLTTQIAGEIYVAPGPDANEELLVIVGSEGDTPHDAEAAPPWPDTGRFATALLR
jgi:hypothetical protein